MPGDVPLDRPAHQLTADARPEEWKSWYWTWDLYFAVGFPLVLAMLATGATATTTARIASVIALSLMVPWYLGLGRRLIRDEDHGWRARVFVGGVFLLFCAAVGFVPMSAFALFAVYPVVFLALPLRRAAPVVVALSLVPVIFAGLFGSTERLLQQLPVSVLCLAFALFVGNYIERIVRQSAERAELIAELEASRAEVGRLSHEAGVAAERSRLAAEIHDTLAQGFTSIVALVQAAEADIGGDEQRLRRRLDLMARTARENLGEARALVEALTPAALGRGSVDQAIGRLLERTGDELDVPAVMRTAGQPRPLPTAVEVVLLRAAQEALANVRKHADARDVTVRLCYQEDLVRLSVSDDGNGFDAARVTGGFGLTGMRARAEQAGGTLTVRSVPGAGTDIELEVPL